MLSWEGQDSGDDQWINEDFFKSLNENGEVVSNNLETLCQTRKSRDKRENCHTVGLFVREYPCGTIVLYDELYGLEGITQFYGILINFFPRLDKDIYEVGFDYP